MSPITKEQLIEYCLTYPACYLDYPFDEEWAVMRHLKNKKAFAFIYHRNNQLCINLKCEPMEADFYRNVYPCITPAYHMNKTHWNTVIVDGSMTLEELAPFIDKSFRLTQPKR